ncbi:uL14 family ribosomal protein [Candidatus Marsarchaeota archaeon]|jgi:large subunit ribosomal protein L14|nr:uL14 family ribosomal protein [Candidatus Marsarchaeota archaeon]MCL5090298.1 uL14 family ribosomal protein [Candidatus Marsarchaeota archaeon]
MKGIATRVSKSLVPGSILTCADNSGAKTLMVINKIGKAGRRGRLPTMGIGDVIKASVKNGTPQYSGKTVRVIIIRQRQPIRRASGLRIKFEDNAGILVSDTNLPIGTEVKGPMAREVIERFVKIAPVASRVI